MSSNISIEVLNRLESEFNVFTKIYVYTTIIITIPLVLFLLFFLINAIAIKFFSKNLMSNFSELQKVILFLFLFISAFIIAAKELLFLFYSILNDTESLIFKRINDAFPFNLFYPFFLFGTFIVFFIIVYIIYNDDDNSKTINQLNRENLKVILISVLSTIGFTCLYLGLGWIFKKLFNRILCPAILPLSPFIIILILFTVCKKKRNTYKISKK